MSSFQRCGLRAALSTIVALGCCASMAFADARVTIINGNAPGVGFNDSTPATPVGGNPGTTRGQQALIAFQRAADIWGEALDSPVEIRVFATFEPQFCTSTAAVLGSATAIFVESDFDGAGAFPGAVRPNIWHPAALADKRAGRELNPATWIPDPAPPTVPPNPFVNYTPVTPAPDIRARFNSLLGTGTCVPTNGWYFGIDDKAPSNRIDLVRVVLHEIGHGLGFQQFASLVSGAQIVNPITGRSQSDVFGVNLFDKTINRYWNDMTNAERVASSINSRHLVWDGPQVRADAPRALQAGTPMLNVHSPEAIRGAYSVGVAGFGPPLTAAGVTGEVVEALDPAIAGSPATTDACSPLTNAAAVAGKIALIDRGTCGFNVKLKNAQDAGAIAAIFINNVAGGPAPGFGIPDPTIPATIPSVLITLADGALLRANLGSRVNATLGLDLTMLSGADVLGRVYVNAPSPVVLGSSVSHWDTLAAPNQLMEPAYSADVKNSLGTPSDPSLPVDLSLSLMHDIGWFADADNDGFTDASDACAHAFDNRATVNVGETSTGVTNLFFTNGCTVQDLINRAADAADTHGDFVSDVTLLVNALRDSGFITVAERKALHTAASHSGQ